jgi:LCP family protein required for cell wall assembly
VARSRINILLTGIDSDERRTQKLNDTLLVVSIDPATGDIAMISFPRDLARLPTPTGGTFDRKINSLMTYAERHPDEYPQGPMAALTDQIGFLLGAPIDYYAAVNLDGFKKLIDRVGGVTVDVKHAIDDPGYGGWDTPGKIGFKLSVGKHTLDGETALAYVRTRKGLGDNDFNRSRRQQELVLALQKKLIDPAMLPNLPGILDDAGKTLTTDFPPERLGEMLSIARASDEATVKRYVLGPPYAQTASGSAEYILVPDMARFAKLSIALFGPESRYAAADGGGG